MGSCYLGDHIAGNHIYSDKSTCNIEEPQQKCRHGTVSYRFLGGGWGGGGLSMFNWIQTLALYFCSGLKHLICMKIS